MSRAPVISATDLASWVLPVPAGPSTSTGLPRRSARYTTPAMPSSARYCTERSPSRTAATDSNRLAASGIYGILMMSRGPGRGLPSAYPSPWPCPRWVLRADLSGSLDDVLVGRQLPKPHGSPGVELLGADADLGAEAELLAVGEAGGGVDHDGGGVDLGGEALGGGQVAGDDGFGVARTVTPDVIDGAAEIVD